MQKDACRVISVCNQKGGVSKSTTVLNLGIGLANEGKKVLLIDMDPQGSSTSGVGIPKSKPVNTAYEVLIGSCRAKDAILETKFPTVVTANVIIVDNKCRFYNRNIICQLPIT